MSDNEYEDKLAPDSKLNALNKLPRSEKFDLDSAKRKFNDGKKAK